MNSTFDLLIKNLETSHKDRLVWFQKNKNEEFNGWLPSYDEDKLLATKASTNVSCSAPVALAGMPS